MTYPVKIIHTSINRPADAVYAFASRPENFPQWVDFIQSIDQEGDSWIAKSEMGDLKIKFTPTNEMGIMDHEVSLPNGQRVNNPMRVVANKEGCEFIFTLFWMPDRTEKEFKEDADAVKSDLLKLKEIMES